MTNTENSLREQVSRAWQRGANEDHPSFDATWEAAVARRTVMRRCYRHFASAAAIVAVIVIGLNVQAPPEKSYVEIADLLESTYWSAPSDVLLPNREFDIYQDMPVLFESTQPAGGALL